MEDVTMMRKQGVEESYLLLVDSAERDTTHDKHPNQYDVVFTTPFVNVVGVDVVTASIPRTQYIVDTNSNTLTFKMASDTAWTTIILSVGDYAITSLITELNNTFSNMASSLQIQALSTPPSLTNRVQFYATQPFQLNMTASLMRRVLGFTEPPTPELANTGAYAMPANYIDTDPDVFVSIAGNVSVVNTVPVFAGPQGSSGDSTVPLSSTAFARQGFVAQSSGSVASIVVYVTVLGTLPSSDQLINFLIVDTDGAQYASGVVSIPSTTTAGSANSFVSSSITSTMPLVAGTQYYCVLYDLDVTSQGSNCYALYAAQLATSTNSTDVSTGQGTSVNSVDWQPYTNQADDLCIGLQVSPLTYQITSPGLYDLTGERYISIRCRQIEDHVFKSRAYEKYNVGLAKIDLGVFGYSDTRFDFSSLPPRRFHPIGRLTRLTFRFECVDGSLYNFYGVNHTMILSIRFISPDETKMRDTKRLLNPSYDPDVQRFVARHVLRDSRHDDDNE